MGFLEAFLLGAIQGLTEFLPVSSSGHLVLASKLLFEVKNDISFDILVHAGSLLAILFYFRDDLYKLFVELKEKTLFESTFFKIILATLPAGLVGLLFKDRIESIFEKAEYAAFFLYITALLLILSEFLSRNKDRRQKDQFTHLEALTIGVFQALAVLPGISRSGSTISAGMLTGHTRESSARFSFLMVIPAIFGAIILDMKDTGVASLLTPVKITGFLGSFIFSFIAIYFLMRFVRKHSLIPFAAYCASIATLYFILR